VNANALDILERRSDWGATILRFKITKPGTSYWNRPDIGIGSTDVVLDRDAVRVRVHSLGGVASPGGRVVVRGRDGREIGSAGIPAMAAPSDLKPKTTDVEVHLRTGADAAGGSVAVELEQNAEEITQRNNSIRL